MASRRPALRTRGNPPGAHLDAYARWLAAAGPWHLWTVCPPLVAPNSPVSAAPQEPDVRALVDELAAALRHGNSLVVLNLDPVVGVHTAARLHQLTVAHTVLVLPRWPYAEAVLPTAQLTRALLDTAPALRGELTTTNVVFVLDPERQQSIVRPSRDPRADNRYRLSPADLPNLAALRRHAIQRVIKVTRQ